MPNINETPAPAKPAKRKKFWKFWLLMALINVGFLVILARLFYVQIVRHEEYSSRARRQHEMRVTLGARRGAIYDREGRLLASTVECVSVAADPTLLKNPGRVASAVAKASGKDRAALLAKIRAARGSFVWLARGLDLDRGDALKALDDPGLIIISEAKRKLCYGPVGAQIIGFTDIDSRGLSGVELAWDSLLRGSNGYMIMNRDGLGRLRPAGDLPIIPASDGASVRLTLDIELQRIVEYELKEAVLSTGSVAGTVVALEPSSGEVLAMASYPGYDPNTGGNMTADAIRIRAITDTYEPGSTFKLITTAAAMEEGLVRPEDKFNGFNGEFHLADVVIRDVHPLGVVTFKEALDQSSNIILSTVASRIPDYKFYKYIRDFGFGITLGIDLPGEVTGKILKPEEMLPASKRYMGFGYGIAATPLQMANAYSSIANNGNLMKPYIVKNVSRSDGTSLFNAKPGLIRKVISDATNNKIVPLFTSIVNNGTGKSARIEGIEIAGKTGTTQQLVAGSYSKRHYTASFVGFFPANKPRIAMLVVLDQPSAGSYYGGATAAPVFRNIALRYLSSSPTALASTQSRLNGSGRIIMPNLVGMKAEGLERYLGECDLGLKNQVSEGIVTAQFPDAGLALPRGTQVTVYINNAPRRPDRKPGELPDVVGLSGRRALAVLLGLGKRVELKGAGRVVAVERSESGGYVLHCSDN
ncbi:MAG: penicillin-binding transpeptidase domain-containing protein [Chloroflexota bacterium]